MNILGLSKIQQQPQFEKKQQPQSFYLSKQSETDSFQRTSNISFKANPQKVAQKILKDPTLSQKFMSLLAMGAATLIATAQGDKTNETSSAETETGFGNLFASMVAEENVEEESQVDELQKYKDELQKCKEEINGLKKEIAEQQERNKKILQENGITLETEPAINTEVSHIEIPESNSEQNSLVSVVFPKKRGRLSKEQTNLKQVVEELHVSEDCALKLGEICSVVINSNAETNKEYSNNLKSFIENLTSLKNLPEALEAYILEQHPLFTSIETMDEIKENDEVSEASPRVYLAAPKVVAKIDLAKIEPHRRTRIQISDPNKDYKNTEINAIDETNEIFKFKIPGTLDSNVKNNLTRLLLRYESHLTEKLPDKPKWMHARPISPRVSKLSIKKEINLRNQGDSPYKNITENDIDMLASLINSEPRFNEYFTLHAALRLIDRLVNFNSDVPVDIQTGMVIDNLLTAIQKGLSNGIEIENYVDHTYNANGARLIINSDPQINPEAFEISGSYNLILGICENQPDPKFYSTRNKTPLICTIFANGI